VGLWFFNERIAQLMIATLMALALLAAPQDAAAQPAAPKMDCAKGPATKTYAGLPWLAYGCSDNASVLLMATGDSPAAPYRFLLSLADDGKYAVTGGGTGDKAIAENAYANLKTMSQDQLKALATQVNALPSAR
jgi:hypothetical protein